MFNFWSLWFANIASDVNILLSFHIVQQAPPLNVSGTVVNSSTIELNWDPPDVEGPNAAVRYYIVNVTEVQTANIFQFTANTTGLSISSLHPSYTYEIAVSAVTIGPGPFSPTLTLQTAEAGAKTCFVCNIECCACLVSNNITFFIAAPSGFPQNFSVSVVTSRSLSLIWNPPPLEDQNGVIIHYRINITVLDSMEMFQLLSDNSSITVNSLIPYTTYMLTIAAETAVGEGPFSGAYTVMTATDGKKQTPYKFIFIDWTYVHKSENCIYTGDC